MKGLILGAGRGTRLQPFSDLVPKVLLPVANKPLIQYNIEKLTALGITEIGIVIKPEHRELFELIVGDGTPWGAHITYIYQHESLGISHAVKQAEPFIQEQPFVLLLGDNLLEQSLEELALPVTNEINDACIMLGYVTRPVDYGIAELENNRIVGLEEKPAVPKSNWAVLGAYAFNASIFDAIRSIQPSKRGEYEITDAIQWLIDQGKSVGYLTTEQNHSDVGTLPRWLEANEWMLDKLNRAEQLPLYPSERGNIIIPPVIIDPGSEITNSTIGPYASIGPGVRLQGCTIARSVVLDGTCLNDASLSHTIVNRKYASLQNGGS